MARTSLTPTSLPIVLSKQLTATLRCSIGQFSAVRRNGRTRPPAGPSQHPTFGGAATTNINKPNSPEVTDRKDVHPSCDRLRTVETYLAQYSNQNFINYRAALSNLFGYALKIGATSENILSSIEKPLIRRRSPA